jgi:hypothetical protein
VKATQLSAAAAVPSGNTTGRPHPDMPRQRGPIVVLTYAHSEAGLLQRMLADSGLLTCTSGSGLLQLCDLAAKTWRGVDKHDGPLSPLAVASIRAMADSLITAIVAGTGGSRWCEISLAPARCAETFLVLYPAARFLCLHRSCPDVICAGIRANPWGLADSPSAPFAAVHPGRSAAALAAYWATCALPLLEFEEAHPEACRRIKSEDLVGQVELAADEISAFLNMGCGNPGSRPSMSEGMLSGVEEAHPPGSASVPLSQIPPPLRARVNELQARIGYEPME